MMKIDETQFLAKIYHSIPIFTIFWIESDPEFNNSLLHSTSKRAIHSATPAGF